MTADAQKVAKFGRSPAFKFFLVSLLTLMLLVPLLIVYGLVSEREGRWREAQQDVARTFGGTQQITGPFIIVPYSLRVETREGDKRIETFVEKRAVFLPETLSIKGDAQTKLLSRSIYDVSVYSAKLSLAGTFKAAAIAETDADAILPRWKDARLGLAISDVSGLKTAATIKIDGADDVPFQPSVGIPGSYVNGIHALIGRSDKVVGAAPEMPGFAFDIDLEFSGSGLLTFAPAARETKVSLSSNWPHPSFTGSFLPVDRSVSAQGFTASWSVPHLARSVPQAFPLTDNVVERFSAHQFGVNFYQPVDLYDAVTRALKYGILFVSAAFMAVFVLELMSGSRVHPVQYLFVGLAMVFFYVMLLSFAEHVGFTAAYVVASLSTGGMLSLYTGLALRRVRSGLIMIVMFLLLYGFLFLILQLEDYALLAGAVLGFVALTTVMFTTLRIDWSGRETTEAEGPEEAGKAL